MNSAVTLVLILTLAGGCSSFPNYIKCKGKGSVSTNQNVIGYAGQAAVNADCGEGFEFEQGKNGPSLKPVVTPEPPK